MRKIRIAQIGANQNSHSCAVLASLRKQTDLFEVVGYALPENERERIPYKMAGYEGLHEMTAEDILADPTIEAVAVETDEIYLTQYAQRVAESGKHLHMEKPGGVSLPEFERLIATVKEKGTVFHTGYMYRYNPFVQELLAQVRNGELGEILSVEAQMNCFHPPKTRQWLENFPGGMMFFLGCHLIDLVLQIQGTPDRVIPLNCSGHTDGVTAEDIGMAVFQYPHGNSFIRTTAIERGGFARRQLVVVGTKGTVEIKPLEWYVPDGDGALCTHRTIRTSDGWHEWGEESKSAPLDRYDGMMAAFAAMVRGETQNPYTPDYELTLYKTVLAACGADV
ncbi:MAG: Gfo/Idh/MocA family oxidoreductase [Ruminococcaceae bacterium]|nr:Gfo/Idh/MocA family oxidoreductase [Oscillospiraceae bacterium]